MCINKITSGLLFVLAGMSAAAQSDLTKTVQVTQVYDPIISDADKIDLVPEGYDTLLNFKSDFQYSIVRQSMMHSSFALRPIPAAKMNDKNYEDPQWFYARLVAGYPLRILGDLYVNNIKPENLSVGLFYNHRSIWTNIDADGRDVPANEMNHGGGIYLRKYWTATTLGVEGGFSRRNLLFYGYNPTTAPNFAFNKDSLSQAYTSFYMAASLKSNDIDINAFRYHIGLHADIFGDNGYSHFKAGRMFAQKENSFGAKGYLGKAFDAGTHAVRLDFDGTAYLADLRYNKHYNNLGLFPEESREHFGELYRKLYGMYGAGSDSLNTRVILNLKPSYIFSSKKIRLQLGVKFTGYDRGEGFKSKIYPIADFSIKLAEEFVPFAGLDGGIEMNDYKTISAENPYILPGMNMIMKATDHSYGIAAGAKGNIRKVFSYNVYGKYSLYKNMYFYRNTNALTHPLENNFDVVYDEMQQWKAGIEMKVTTSAIHAMLSGVYYSYVLDRLAAPYHCPSLVVDLDVNVIATKNLSLNLNVHARNKSPYAHGALSLNTAYYNNAFVDLGLGTEYAFNRSVSIFVVFNNILNRHYEKWHLYKVPGIGALGGVSVKF